MPDTGGRELHGLASWRSLTHIIGRFKNVGREAAEAGDKIEQIHQANDQTTRQRNYSNFIGNLEGIKGTVGGSRGLQLDATITKFVAKVKSLGGLNITSVALTRELESLKTQIDSLGGKATNKLDTELIAKLSHGIEASAKEASKNGFASMRGSGHDTIRAAFDFKENKSIGDATASFTEELKARAKELHDPALKDAVLGVAKNFEKASKSAKTSTERINAFSKATEELNSIDSPDSHLWEERVLSNLAKKGATFASEANKSTKEKEAHNKAITLQDRTARVMQGFGKALVVAQQVRQIVDAGVSLFSAVNGKVNQYARMGMAVSAERGAYGRMIRGSGIRYGDMMAAIGAGRSAGMDDRQVINQMVGLQTQLAIARWGEGPLTNTAGRWGISTYNADGSVKTQAQMMLEYSRKLRSLGSESEKLQFLTHMGFSPQQMEFVANYEKHAQRMAYLRENPNAAGILERADILDENGMSARIDAATRIELKRRQILNQNAIDRGIIPGMIRAINPENWLFNDWTARQIGKETAESEKAQENFVKELARVQSALRENTRGLNSNTKELGTSAKSVPLMLDAQTLQGLALQGGWAEADIRNRGQRSAIYGLRKLYAQKMGTEDLSDTIQKDKFWSSNIAAAGGTVGGVGIGALLGAGLGFLLAGPAGAAIGAIAGGSIGGIGGGVGASYAAYNNPFLNLDDGSKKHVKALRGMRGNAEAIENYAKRHGLYGLTPEMVESKDFEDDEKAKKSLQGAFVIGATVKAQELTDKEIDFTRAMQFTEDKKFKALQRMATVAGKPLEEKRFYEAMARHGTGDESIGMDSMTAYAFMKYGADFEDQAKKQAQINRRIAELRVQAVSKGEKFNYKGAKEQAENEWQERWVSENITPEMYAAATKMSEEDKAKLEQNAAGEWEAKFNAEIGGSAIARARYISNPNELANAIRAKELEIKNASNSPALMEKFQKELEGLKGLQELSEYGTTKEAYIKARVARRNEDLDKKLFPNGKKPFAFLSDKEKTARINDILGGGETEKIVSRTQKQIAGLPLGEKPTDEQRAAMELEAKMQGKTIEQIYGKSIAEWYAGKEGVPEGAYVTKVLKDVSSKEVMGLSTAKERLSYMQKVLEARGTKATEEQIADAMMSAEEVKQYRADLASGAEISEDRRKRYEMWQQGTKARAEKEEQKRKKEEEEAKKKQEEEAKYVEADVAARYENAEGALPALPTQEGGKVDKDKVFQSMRLAQAKGYDLTKGGYSQALLDEYNKREGKRQQRFKELYGGEDEAQAEAAWKQFREREDAIIQGRGNTLSKAMLEMTKEQQKQIENAPVESEEYVPLNEEPTYTATEKAEIAGMFADAKIASAKAKLEHSGFSSPEESFDAVTGINETAQAVEEQAATANAIKVQQAEAAAARINEAILGGGMTAEKNVTINFGGQTITQNISGEYPMDTAGMKKGTKEGMTEIRDETAEAIMLVAKSGGIF